mmetsp:Transcript_112808/g.319548  ORF Transcript_112808/g.319548 Transcript_112808/m.319548 type:complete len:177 (+) Transcript_112808:99-629(+)
MQTYSHDNHMGGESMETNDVEQGSAIVRLFAFGVSVFSCVLALWHLVNITTLFSNLILYLIAIYQVVFSLSTVMFESKPEWIQTFEERTKIPVSRYQDLLIDNAKFLALAGGRGLFYFFQGTLWLAFGLNEFPNLLCGGLFCLVGAIHVLMHFGIMPEHVATKVREGYEKVQPPGS